MKSLHHLIAVFKEWSESTCSFILVSIILFCLTSNIILKIYREPKCFSEFTTVSESQNIDCVQT